MISPYMFVGTGMPDPGWWEALWPDPGSVLAQLHLQPGMSVVDLCGGDGWFTKLFASLTKHVTVVEIDAELVDRSKMRLAEGGATNCAFVVADAYELPALVPSPVDLVFLANTFHGVHDKPRLARAVCEVLKPDGFFAVVNWHARLREDKKVFGIPRGPKTELRMTPMATILTVETSGFMHRETLEVSPYHYCALFQKVTKT